MKSNAFEVTSKEAQRVMPWSGIDPHVTPTLAYMTLEQVVLFSRQ